MNVRLPFQPWPLSRHLIMLGGMAPIPQVALPLQGTATVSQPMVLMPPLIQQAPCYPSLVNPTIMNETMIEKMIEKKLTDRGGDDYASFNVYKVSYLVHRVAKKLPPSVSKPSKFGKFNG